MPTKMELENSPAEEEEFTTVENKRRRTADITKIWEMKKTTAKRKQLATQRKSKTENASASGYARARHIS